jgi:hypothetical protein
VLAVAVEAPEVVAVDPRAAAVVVAPRRAATNAASDESTARRRSSGLSSRSIAVRWRSDAPSLAFLPAAAAEWQDGLHGPETQQRLGSADREAFR